MDPPIDVKALRRPAPVDAPVLAVASTQWATWWQRLLEGGGFWPDDKRRADLPQLTHDPEIEPLFYWGTEFSPVSRSGRAYGAWLQPVVEALA